MHQITILEHDLFEKINNAPRIFITISSSEIKKLEKLRFGKVKVPFRTMTVYPNKVSDIFKISDSIAMSDFKMSRLK